MASSRVRELHKLLLEDLGGSWGLSEFAKSKFIGPVGVWEAHKSRSVVLVSVWRLPRMLRSHDLSCLSVFGGLPGGVWRPPGWLLHVFGSSTSSSWRTLEVLGGSRSLQNQDSSALSVSGRLTSHDLSCLSVSGGLPKCSEVTIYRACQCLEASQGATRQIGGALAGLRRT